MSSAAASRAATTASAENATKRGVSLCMIVEGPGAGLRAQARVLISAVSKVLSPPSFGIQALSHGGKGLGIGIHLPASPCPRGAFLQCRDYVWPLASMKARWLRRVSSMWSPPNFSSMAPARISAIIASPTTQPGGTWQTSLRS